MSGGSGSSRRQRPDCSAERKEGSREQEATTAIFLRRRRKPAGLFSTTSSNARSSSPGATTPCSPLRKKQTGSRRRCLEPRKSCCRVPGTRCSRREASTWGRSWSNRAFTLARGGFRTRRPWPRGASPLGRGRGRAGEAPPTRSICRRRRSSTTGRSARRASAGG